MRSEERNKKLKGSITMKAGSWEGSQNPKARLSTADTFASIVFLLRCKCSTHISSLFASLYQRKGKRMCKIQQLVLSEIDILFIPPLPCQCLAAHLGSRSLRLETHPSVHRGPNFSARLNTHHAWLLIRASPGGTSLLLLTCRLSTCKRRVVLADRSHSFPANSLPFKARNMIFH